MQMLQKKYSGKLAVFAEVLQLLKKNNQYFAIHYSIAKYNT